MTTEKYGHDIDAIRAALADASKINVRQQIEIECLKEAIDSILTASGRPQNTICGQLSKALDDAQELIK